MQGTSPTISVIVVNYDTSHLVNRLLESLASVTLPLEVLIVDNPSGSEDWKNIQSQSVIKNSLNVGYGIACNIAAEHASGSYVCILNPDTIVTNAAMEAWLDTTRKLKDISRVGCTGPALLNENGTTQRSHYRFPGPLTYWPYHSLAGGFIKNVKKRLGLEMTPASPGTVSTDWIMGAAMMFPRESWNDVKGFDPDYFLYAEDTDICMRLKKKGLDIFYCGKVSIVHSQGESSPETRDVAVFRFFSGLMTFARKHLSPYSRLSLRACISLDMISRILIFLPLCILGGGILNRKRIKGYGRVLKMAVGMSAAVSNAHP